MSRPTVVLLLLAAFGAAGLAGCLGNPSGAAERAAGTETPTPTPQSVRTALECTSERLLQWRHDPDLVQTAAGATTLIVDADVDRLVIDGASGSYVSTGWRASIANPEGRPVFVIAGKGVTPDSVDGAALFSGGILGGFLDRLLGKDPEPEPTRVPVAAADAKPVAAPVGHRVLEDPMPGPYAFAWQTQGIVYGLGVTVTALRCA